MPTSDESVRGGHAVLLVGYDDATKRWLVRNSWGDGWGKGGYFTMPYGYLLDDNLSDDFWNITMVEMPDEDQHVVPTPASEPDSGSPWTRCWKTVLGVFSRIFGGRRK
jgi:hypothetical protein